MQKILYLGLVFSLTLCSCAFNLVPTGDGDYPEIKPAFTTEPIFKNPESIVFDPITTQLFVSNVNGHPLEKDGNGFISKVAIDGAIRDLYWLTGLNAPKGMTLIGDLLYIADIDQLVVVDITNKLTRHYPAPGARFLNGVIHDATGTVYISDFMGDTIYAFKDQEISVWLTDDQLKSPNGLHVRDGFLYIGCWGEMVDGFKTTTAGDVLRVSLQTKDITIVTTELGNLDGLDLYNNLFILTDFMAGSLFILDQGKLVLTIPVGAGAADLCVLPEDWELIFIPMMNDHVLKAYSIRERP